MTCSICNTRYALSQPIVDKAGNKRAMCIQCAVEQGKPQRFPEGTLPSPRMPQRNDFADDERSALGREVEMATAQRDALAACLADLLRLFRRELAGGYSTAEAQQALRCARAMLAEIGVAV